MEQQMMQVIVRKNSGNRAFSALILSLCLIAGLVSTATPAAADTPLTITYDSQGGTPVPDGETTTGGSIGSSPGTPTLEDHTFLGWLTGPDELNPIQFPFAHGQADHFTLYAQWTSNNTITWDDNGANQVHMGGSVSYVRGSLIAQPPLNPPIRAGYYNVFRCRWSRDARL
jgi:uncharacterized repeat protein (TIGR02543 family)